MAQKQNNTNLSVLLFSFMNQPDPMLSMLQWLCEQMVEAEISLKLNADKSERSDGRSGYRSGYRPRRLDTRLGTIYLMVPKVRQGSLKGRQSLLWRNKNHRTKRFSRWGTCFLFVDDDLRGTMNLKWCRINNRHSDGS